jgi:hypothetical protein
VLFAFAFAAGIHIQEGLGRDEGEDIVSRTAFEDDGVPSPLEISNQGTCGSAVDLDSNGPRLICDALPQRVPSARNIGPPGIAGLLFAGHS